jgi:hypothetical protein
MPRITRSVSSGSPGAGIQVWPLRSRNSTVARERAPLVAIGQRVVLDEMPAEHRRLRLEV